MNDATPTGNTQAKTKSQLTAYVERMERMLDEIDQLKDGLKDLKAEIKSAGFNVKAIVLLFQKNAQRIGLVSIFGAPWCAKLPNYFNYLGCL